MTRKKVNDNDEERAKRNFAEKVNKMILYNWERKKKIKDWEDDITKWKQKIKINK